jgi:hypothetical protein
MYEILHCISYKRDGVKDRISLGALQEKLVFTTSAKNPRQEPARQTNYVCYIDGSCFIGFQIRGLSTVQLRILWVLGD